MEPAISILASQISDHNIRMSRLESANTEVASSISSLTTEVRTLSADIVSMSACITSLTEKVDTLSGVISGMTAVESYKAKTKISWRRVAVDIIIGTTVAVVGFWLKIL